MYMEYCRIQNLHQDNWLMKIPYTKLYVMLRKFSYITEVMKKAASMILEIKSWKTKLEAACA